MSTGACLPNATGGEVYIRWLINAEAGNEFFFRIFSLAFAVTLEHGMK
jgi:hypothetical protein